MRLIDADALMKDICGNECGSICDEECEKAWCNYYDYIMDAPTIVKSEDLQCKRVYDADAVDALFSGCVDPLNPTKEDQHKAYARLMLSRLQK